MQNAQKCNKEDLLVNEYEKQNKNSNKIGYGRLFSKNYIGHLRVLNTNALLFLFFLSLQHYTWEFKQEGRLH